MIEKLRIQNLRGIRELEVEGLGRVNLIVGRNGSGKTTLLAAAGMHDAPGAWIFVAPYLDDPRPAPLGVDAVEKLFVPLCPGADTAILPEIWVTRNGEEHGLRLEVSRGRKPGGSIAMTHLPDGAKYAIRVQDGEWDVFEMPAGTTSISGAHCYWAPAFVEAERDVVAGLIEVYKTGRLGQVLEAIQLINPVVSAVELAGSQVFVRLEGHPLPLPFGVLGDGARRALEFALGFSHDDVSTVLIDEIENGFHYSTLPKVLELIRQRSLDTGAQVFATTHRDEVIEAACTRFIEAGDDGLRILRIDRTGDEHRVVSYTAEEALAGMETGLELRG